jgi:hypothetical protein
MKKITYCLVLPLFLFALATSVLGQTTSTSKVFSKSFSIDKSKTILLDLPGKVELKEWDGPALRFEITVAPPTGTNPAMINELANVGRYNLVAADVVEGIKITAPNTVKPVKVKGQDYKEIFSFVVSVPKGVTVEVMEAATVQIPANK